MFKTVLEVPYSIYFSGVQVPKVPGASPVLVRYLPSGPSCREATPLPLGPSEKRIFPFSSLHVPLAVHIPVLITYVPSSLMVQVLPDVVVPYDDWYVMLPDHFPVTVFMS